MTKTYQLFLSSILLVGSASAATITVNGTPTIPDTTTNWSGNINIPQFNPALGTLTGVTVDFGGDISGMIKLENTSPTSQAHVNSQLSAVLTLELPNTTPLVTLNPTQSFTDTLSTYDGVFDFGGTSGITHMNVAANTSGFATLSSASDLALFTGLGSVSLPALATAASSAVDGGNLITQFQTLAGANASVVYTYNPGSSVPEPSSLGLMGLGFGAIGLIGRRLKKA